MNTNQTQLPEVEEFNRNDLNHEALEKFLTFYGERVDSLKSSVGFYHGIYVKTLTSHPLVKKITFLHVVGGPRKDGYLRYTFTTFLLCNDGRIISHSLLCNNRKEYEPNCLSLEDMKKMIELAPKYLQ